MYNLLTQNYSDLIQYRYPFCVCFGVQGFPLPGFGVSLFKQFFPERFRFYWVRRIVAACFLDIPPPLKKGGCLRGVSPHLASFLRGF